MSSSLHKCEVCESNANLFRCSNCQTTWYCGREHQQAHRIFHENECNATKDNEGTARREKSLWEENAEVLYDITDDEIEDYQHLFHLMAKKRPTLEDRGGVIEAISEIFFPEDISFELLGSDTEFDEYSAAMGWVFDTKFPYLLLQRNEDQKCYDFMKWWHTPKLHGIYSNRGVILPRLELMEADVFEPCDIFTNEHPSLAQVSALMLLKIRLLTDLQVLRIVSEVTAGKLPQEIVDMIHRMALNSPSILAQSGIMNTADLNARTNDLKAQIQKLYDCAKEYCPSFWASLPYPGKRPVAKRPYWTGYIDEEMRQIASYAYESWMETPGALDIVRTLAENDKGSE